MCLLAAQPVCVCTCVYFLAIGESSKINTHNPRVCKNASQAEVDDGWKIRDQMLASDFTVCAVIVFDASSDFKSAEPQALRAAAVDKDIL